MTNIRLIEMMFLDEVFDMGDGYVLNFSDYTFAQFFAEELDIEFDYPPYARNGAPRASDCAACCSRSISQRPCGR